MDKKIDATIISTYDSTHEYFLVINRETGKEVDRFSTEDFGTFRYDDDYNRKDVMSRIVQVCHIGNYVEISW